MLRILKPALNTERVVNMLRELMKGSHEETEAYIACFMSVNLQFDPTGRCRAVGRHVSPEDRSMQCCQTSSPGCPAGYDSRSRE